MNRVGLLLLLATSSCISRVPPSSTETGAGAEAAAAPSRAPSGSGYRARFEAIASTSPEALDQLGALRAEIMRAYLRERAGIKIYSSSELKTIGQMKGPNEMEKAIKPQQDLDKRWAKDVALLQDIKARRAALWAGKGDAFAVLAEYAWPRSFGAGEEFVPSCRGNAAECRTAVDALTAEFGRLPPVLNEHAASVITGVDSNVERFALVDVNVQSATPAGKGFLVTGLTYGPGKTRNCHGYYQTNEITKVTPTTITITQTDWCKKITFDPALGVELHYEVASSVPVAAKTQLRLLVDKRDVKCVKSKSTKRCHFKNTRVVAVDNGEQAEAGNQQFASAETLPH